jgi:hypothetical protein
MLIRFRIQSLDPDSGHAVGVLVAAHTLRDEGDLTVREHEELRLALAWFNENLFIPAILENKEHRRAISWFRPNAQDAIRRMWDLKRILDAHGHHVDVIRCVDPGTIVYEDEHQVIAKPPKGQRF